MARPLLRTSRIRLEPMTPAHLPLLHELDTDAEVMRYLLGRPRTPQEVEDFWAPHCSDDVADRVGLGWWVGFNGTDEFLGWWDLAPNQAESGEPVPHSAEIGWRVARRHWRQGLASEGAQALLDHAFATLSLDYVWAETRAVNLPSRGVMTKLGMTHVETVPAVRDPLVPGAEDGDVIYRLTRLEWAEQAR